MIDKFKVPLAIIAGAVVIGLFVYFGLKTQKAGQVTSTVSPTTSPVATTVVVNQSTVSPLPTPSPSPQFTQDDEKAIKAAMAKKLPSTDGIIISVTQKTSTVAKGSVSAQGGGGYFLAAKTDNGWIIVYDGQSNPTCAQIAPYNFPTNMVPECLNSSGNVVTR